MSDWTRVRGASSQVTGNATPTLAITAPNSGSILCGGVAIDPGTYLKSVTDNKGNAYVLTTSSENIGTIVIAGFMSAGLITNGPTTLTFHLSAASATYGCLGVDEFTPPTGCTSVSLDGTTGFAGDTGLSSQLFQTLHNDALIYSFTFATTLTVGAGFTLGLSPGAPDTFSEYMVQATAGNSNQIVWGSAASNLWGIGFGVAPVAQTSWAPVQMKQAVITTSQTSISVALPNPMQKGNIFCAAFGIGGAAMSSIVDDLGTHYESNVLQTVANHGIFWPGGLLGSTPQTITVNFSGASTDAKLVVIEFAPPPGTVSVAADASNQNSYLSGGNITTLTAGNISPVKNNDLLYTFISGVPAPANPTGGFCTGNNYQIGNTDAYFRQPSAGTTTCTWTFGANASVVAFIMAISATQGAMSNKPWINIWPASGPPLGTLDDTTSWIIQNLGTTQPTGSTLAQIEAFCSLASVATVQASLAFLQGAGAVFTDGTVYWRQLL